MKNLSEQQLKTIAEFKNELQQLLNKWDAEIAVENFSGGWVADYRLVANVGCIFNNGELKREAVQIDFGSNFYAEQLPADLD